MKKVHFLLVFVSIISLFLLVGCGEKLGVSPKQKSAFLGDEFKVDVDFSRWYTPFEDIEIISRCDQINISSQKINSQRVGKISADLKIVKTFSKPLNCLQFKSNQHNEGLNLIISPRKQAELGISSYESQPTFGNEYAVDMKIDIVEIKRDKPHNFSITFETSSPQVYSDGEDINSFTIESASTESTSQLTPSFNIRIDNTGDSQRTVKLKISLSEKIGDESHLVDFEEISFSAHE